MIAKSVGATKKASRQVTKRKRIAVIASPEKAGASDVLERVKRWAASRAEVTFAELTFDSRAAMAQATKPELLFVLGGDGTLIGAIHGLAEAQIPIVGINLGKLGYLADFTIDELEREGDFIVGDSLPLTRRAMMEVALHSGGATQISLAVNDCVIHAGTPFHMIELRVDADGIDVTNVRGDGVIASTATGSTAHNLSAGGPILEPNAEHFILTPICPHALTYRPLVLESTRRISIRAMEANIGTTASIDGRVQHPFQVGDEIVITRYAHDALLVRNPKHSPWHALRRKLMWGEGPNNH